MERAKSSAGLEKRFGLLQATALNMTNMIGVGPFITIPTLMSALGGPQSMLGWLVAIVITMTDGMIWSELGAAFPGSGGSYLYLREGFGRAGFGRVMAFLFIWQFIFSGPLEIASGYIGFAQYLGYLWPAVGSRHSLQVAVAAVVGVANILLLYRQIRAIGRITIALWMGTILTTVLVIIIGGVHFDPKLAFDFPPGAFRFSFGFVMGLGAASRIGIYDYLGYYDVCYIGAEVRNPGRVIPRSIMYSILGVAVIYFTMNLCIIGVVPWRSFVPAENNPNANYVVSLLMEKVCGRKAAEVFTMLVLWTAFGSVFALLLGYSRIPYAAAQDGYFFKVFGKVHPTKHFPHVSLVVIGLISIGCSAFSLDEVINALLTTRILVQFIGQIIALMRLRRVAPGLARPYKVWLYPLTCWVALAGWLFAFITAGTELICYGLLSLVVGLLFFRVWSRQRAFAVRTG